GRRGAGVGGGYVGGGHCDHHPNLTIRCTTVQYAVAPATNSARANSQGLARAPAPRHTPYAAVLTFTQGDTYFKVWSRPHASTTPAPSWSCPAPASPWPPAGMRRPAEHRPPPPWCTRTASARPAAPGRPRPPACPCTDMPAWHMTHAATAVPAAIPPASLTPAASSPTT